MHADGNATDQAANASATVCEFAQANTSQVTSRRRAIPPKRIFRLTRDQIDADGGGSLLPAYAHASRSRRRSPRWTRCKPTTNIAEVLEPQFAANTQCPHLRTGLDRGHRRPRQAQEAGRRRSTVPKMQPNAEECLRDQVSARFILSSKPFRGDHPRMRRSRSSSTFYIKAAVKAAGRTRRRPADLVEVVLSIRRASCFAGK